MSCCGPQQGPLLNQAAGPSSGGAQACSRGCVAALHAWWHVTAEMAANSGVLPRLNASAPTASSGQIHSGGLADTGLATNAATYPSSMLVATGRLSARSCSDRSSSGSGNAAAVAADPRGDAGSYGEPCYSHQAPAVHRLRPIGRVHPLRGSRWSARGRPLNDTRAQVVGKRHDAADLQLRRDRRAAPIGPHFLRAQNER